MEEYFKRPNNGYAHEKLNDTCMIETDAVSNLVFETRHSICFQISPEIITEPLSARYFDGIQSFTDLTGQTFFMQNLQVGQLIPNFLEAERVKLFALGILDVSEGAFGGGDFREIVQKRIEQFGRDRVFIGNGFVANLLDGLQFGVLQDFGEDALFVRVGNEG